jgi:hypothetical protein
VQYSESSYYGRRDFILEPPHIFAKGRHTPDGTEYDCKVELHSLNPEYSRLRLRNPFLNFAIGLMAVGFCGSVYAGEKMLSGFGAALFWCAVSFLIAGFICVLCTIRKIPAVSFQTKTGIAAIVILQAGPRKNDFVDFVDAVREAILAAQNGRADGDKVTS